MEKDLATHRLILKITSDRHVEHEQTEGRIEQILAELKNERERVSPSPLIFAYFHVLFLEVCEFSIHFLMRLASP